MNGFTDKLEKVILSEMTHTTNVMYFFLSVGVSIEYFKYPYSSDGGIFNIQEGLDYGSVEVSFTSS